MDLKGLAPQAQLISTNIDQRLEEAKKAKTGSKDETEKAATDFEALLLNQMFGEMWKTVPKSDLLGGSNEEMQFRDMYTEALSKEVAQKQSLGIKKVILKEFEKRQNASSEGKD